MANITRKQIIEQARTWLGTPYAHQGRTKGVRVDCFGVLVGVAHELGISNYDTLDYSESPDGAIMESGLSRHMIKLTDWHDALPGDWLHLSFMLRGKRGMRRAQHLALITAPGQILHAYSRKRKVVEHAMDDDWSRMIRAAYQVPGVV